MTGEACELPPLQCPKYGCITEEPSGPSPLERLGSNVAGGIRDAAVSTYRANEAVGDAIIDFATDPDRLETYACGALGTAAGALVGGATKNPKAGAAVAVGVGGECSLS